MTSVCDKSSFPCWSAFACTKRLISVGLTDFVSLCHCLHVAENVGCVLLSTVGAGFVFVLECMLGVG